MAHKERPRKRRFYGLWILLAFIILLPFAFVFLIAIGAFGELPSTTQLENPKTPLATEVYSSDGVILGKYFNENRSPVTYQELSPQLVNALIATEDYRFYQHSGVDFRRLFTIIFYNAIGKRQGGSTLTQQLAKNLFPRENMHNPVKLGIRKIKEWLMAIKLEKLYTKEEILAMYLNTVDFGSNAKGIKSAASTFFSKSPDQLNAIESAVLVGLLKAPSAFNPVRNPHNSLMRRNTVLYQMNRYGFLSDANFSKLKKEPTVLNYRVESHIDGEATYFREYLRQWLDRWADANGYDIYNDGLKIHTTINSKMQKYAEEAVYRHMKEMQSLFFKQFGNGRKPWSETPEIIDLTVKRSERYRAMKEDGVAEPDIIKSFNKPLKMKVFSYRGDVDTIMSPLDSIKYYKYYLQPGFMAMEPSTGAVKVWVGGVDYKFFKYDHVDPKAKRQVGSTFKPFVYATAIMNGYSPCLKVPNVPVVFENYDNWSPRNSDGKYGGLMTLKKGLATSTNCITAWVMKEVGVEPVVKLAQKMGIKSNLEPVPSLCLGTADISVYEMVSAFNTFNNKGMYAEPLLVTEIDDKNGNVIQNFVTKTVDVMDEKKNYVMIDMLKGVTNSSLYGTGSRLRFKYNLRGPMAGKTGTTQNNSDGWFIGLIPDLTGGIWVGAEDRAVHFDNMAYGQGATIALPIWAYFLQSVYADPDLHVDPNKDWEVPAGELGVEIDCSKYEDPGSGSDNPEADIFGNH